MIFNNVLEDALPFNAAKLNGILQSSPKLVFIVYVNHNYDDGHPFGGIHLYEQTNG